MFRGLRVKSKKDRVKRDFYDLYKKSEIVVQPPPQLVPRQIPPREDIIQAPPPPQPPQRKMEETRSYSKLVDSKRARSKGYTELNPDFNPQADEVNTLGNYSFGDGGRSWRSRIQQRERERVNDMNSGMEDTRESSQQQGGFSTSYRRDFSVLSRGRMKKPEEHSFSGKKRKRNTNRRKDYEENYDPRAPKKKKVDQDEFDPMFMKAVEAQMKGNSKQFEFFSRKFEEKSKREEKKSLRNEFGSERESEYDYNRGFQQYVVSHRNYSDDPTVGTGEDHDFLTRKGNRGRGRGRGRGRQHRQRGRSKAKLGALNARCRHCYNSQSFQKNLVVSLGNHSWLGLPHFGQIVEGHCVAVPMEHKHQMMSSVEKGSSVYQEMMKFQHTVSEMFREQGKRCLFLETVTPRHIRERMHTSIEIIPIPERLFPTSRTYFQKALKESTRSIGKTSTSATSGYNNEDDVTHQRRTIEVRAGGISKSVPAGMPYFYVGFEWEGGLAYVIDEGEGSFPFQFGKDVVAGMLGLDQIEVRNRKHAGVKNEDVLKFVEMYKKYDWTLRLD